MSWMEWAAIFLILFCVGRALDIKLDLLTTRIEELNDKIDTLHRDREWEPEWLNEETDLKKEEVS